MTASLNPRRIGLALVAAAAIGSRPAGGGQDPPAATRPDDATAEVSALLRAGRLDEGLRRVQAAYLASPDNPAVRQEFIALHLAMARHMLADERFAAAEAAARAVLAVDPGNRAAAEMAASIVEARADVPRRIADARLHLRLEWHESAYETFRQASALRPQERAAWVDDMLAASEGAGDDHYFCKNFGQAYFYYDVCLHSGREPRPSLRRRWLQSLVLSLAEDVDRVNYPIEYWQAVVTGAEPRAERRDDVPLCVLRGLANENLGDPVRAAANYAEALRQPSAPPSAPESLRALRRRAVARVREAYDPSLSPRRAGLWQVRQAGGWQARPAGRFVIHHRNPEAADRLADALALHFDRVAAFLELRPSEIAWPVPCHVFLHADLRTLRAATGRPAAVRAVSRIAATGGRATSLRVDFSQDDPLLLSTTVPHEMMHLLVAWAGGYRPSCAVLDEGLALKVEPRCRAVQFRRLLQQYGAPRPWAALVAVAEPHPADQPRFYAEAAAVADVLLGRGRPADVLRCAVSDDATAELRRRFSFPTTAELDAELARRRAPPVGSGATHSGMKR